MPEATRKDYMRANPRKQGESVFDYNKRIADMSYPGMPTLDLTPFVKGAGDLFNSVVESYNKPPVQAQGEPDIIFGTRSMLGKPMLTPFGIPLASAAAEKSGKFVNEAARGLPQTMAAAMDTPAAREERRKAASASAPKGPAGTNPFPKSYADPAYDSYDAAAAKEFGIPDGLLHSIRVNGERSNNDQVSSAGARSPYQITPSTRKAIQDKYGFDPLSSPENAARGAAIVLRDGYRAKGDWGSAARWYVGGGGPQSEANRITSDNYADRVMGNIKAQGGIQGGYDPTYDNMALTALDAANTAAKQPFSTTFDLPDAPATPDLQTAPGTDFTKQDAALEKLKPAEYLEKEKLQTRRTAWLKGIGQALAASPEGVGVGRLLAMVGGGALAGAATGDEEVRARQDKLDDQMARYNVAVFNNEGQKAGIIHQEAVANVQVMNQKAVMAYEQAFNVWKANNSTSVTEGGVTTSRYDAKSGKVTITRLPIASAVDAATYMQKAQLYGRMGEQQNRGQSIIDQATNSAIISSSAIAAQNKTGSPDDTAAAVVTGPAFVAVQAVSNGAWVNMVGEEQARVFSDEARKAAQMQGMQPGSKQYDEFIAKNLANQLVMVAMGQPDFRKKLMQYQPMAAGSFATDMFMNSKTTTRTGPKGTTTTQSQEAQ